MVHPRNETRLNLKPTPHSHWLEESIYGHYTALGASCAVLLAAARTFDLYRFAFIELGSLDTRILSLVVGVRFA